MNHDILKKFTDGEPVLKELMEDIFKYPCTVSSYTPQPIQGFDTFQELKEAAIKSQTPDEGFQVFLVLPKSKSLYSKLIKEIDDFDFLKDTRKDSAYFLELLDDRFVVIVFGKALSKIWVNAYASKIIENARIPIEPDDNDPIPGKS
jgi:hypothetical protein